MEATATTTLLPPNRAYHRLFGPSNSFGSYFWPLFGALVMFKFTSYLYHFWILIGLMPPIESKWDWEVLSYIWFWIELLVSPLFMALTLAFLIKHVKISWLILVHLFLAAAIYPFLVSTYDYSRYFTFSYPMYYTLWAILTYQLVRFIPQLMVAIPAAIVLNFVVFKVYDYLERWLFPLADYPPEQEMSLLLRTLVTVIISAVLVAGAFVGIKHLVDKTTTVPIE